MMIRYDKRFLLIPIFLFLAVFLWMNSRQALPQALQYRFNHLLESRAKSRSGLYQQEIAFYLTRIQRNPNDGLDRAALAATYLQRARVSGEASWYLLAQNSAERSLVALPILNAGALLVLAEVALAQHQFTQAQALLERIKKITPQSAAVLSLQTTIDLALGHVPAAAKNVQILMQGAPSMGHVLLAGLVHEAQGLDAKTDYEAALQLEEADDLVGSARARTYLARWYLRNGQLPLARDLLLEAIRIVPNDSQAILLLADTQVQLGNFDAAMTLYQQLEQDSQKTITVFNHAALRGMARVKRLRGQEDRALWQQAKDSLRAELKTGAFGHARELAALLLEAGQKSEIAEALKLATHESTIRSDSQTLYVLAWAQLEAGNALAARATLQRALRFGVQDAALMQRIGQIEIALGNKQEADAWFAKAKKINPTLERISQLENNTN